MLKERVLKPGRLYCSASVLVLHRAGLIICYRGNEVGWEFWVQGWLEVKWLLFRGFPFLITLHKAAGSLPSGLLTFVVAGSAGMADFTWAAHHTLLECGCLTFFSYHSPGLVLKSSRKKTQAQLNRLVSVPLNEQPYQALKSFSDVKHFIKALCYMHLKGRVWTLTVQKHQPLKSEGLCLSLSVALWIALTSNPKPWPCLRP